MYRALFIFLLVASCESCTSEYLFAECRDDRDCKQDTVSSSPLYCTEDHLCVLGTPAAKLCTEIYPLGSPANAIVIGALVEDPAANDPLLLKSYKLAIDQINSLRGSNPPLALHVCLLGVTDDDPLKAMKVLARERKAVAVLGPGFSREVMAIESEVIRSGIPILSAGATAPEISTLGTVDGPINGLFFRVVPSDALQGPVLARQLPMPFPSNKKLAMLFVDETYGRGLNKTFAEASTRQPDPIVAYDEPLGAPDANGTEKAVATLLANSPDYVVAIPNRYADQVLKEMFFQPRAAGLSQIFMPETGKTQTVLDLLNVDGLRGIDKLLDRVVGTAPTVDITSPSYMKFARDFATRWPGDSDPNSTVFTAYAYDAMFALGIVVGAAASDVTAARVSELLLRINGHNTAGCVVDSKHLNTVSVGMASYPEAINSVMTSSQGQLVLQGLSGNICFSSHGDRIGGNYEQWSIDTSGKAFHSTPIIQP